LMVFIFDLWAPSIVPVIAIALLLGKAKERVISPFAAIPAMLAGIVLSLVWNYVLHEPLELPSLIAGIITNLLTIFIVHKLTSKKQPSKGFSQESLDLEASRRNIPYVILEYPSICIDCRLLFWRNCRSIRLDKTCNRPKQFKIGSLQKRAFINLT